MNHFLTQYIEHMLQLETTRIWLSNYSITLEGPNEQLGITMLTADDKIENFQVCQVQFFTPQQHSDREVWLPGNSFVCYIAEIKPLLDKIYLVNEQSQMKNIEAQFIEPNNIVNDIMTSNKRGFTIEKSVNEEAIELRAHKGVTEIIFNFPLKELRGANHVGEMQAHLNYKSPDFNYTTQWWGLRYTELLTCPFLQEFAPAPLLTQQEAHKQFFANLCEHSLIAQYIKLNENLDCAGSHRKNKV